MTKFVYVNNVCFDGGCFNLGSFEKGRLLLLLLLLSSSYYYFINLSSSDKGDHFRLEISASASGMSKNRKIASAARERRKKKKKKKKKEKGKKKKKEEEEEETLELSRKYFAKRIPQCLPRNISKSASRVSSQETST